MIFNGIGMITEDLALKNIIMEHDFSYFVTVQPKRVIGLNLAKTLFHGVLRSINEKKKSKWIFIYQHGNKTGFENNHIHFLIDDKFYVPKNSKVHAKEILDCNVKVYLAQLALKLYGHLHDPIIERRFKDASNWHENHKQSWKKFVQSNLENFSVQTHEVDNSNKMKLASYCSKKNEIDSAPNSAGWLTSNANGLQWKVSPALKHDRARKDMLFEPRIAPKRFEHHLAALTR